MPWDQINSNSKYSFRTHLLNDLNLSFFILKIALNIVTTSLGLQDLNVLIHIIAHSTECDTEEVFQNVNYYLWQRLLHQCAYTLLFPGTQLDYISQVLLKFIVAMSGKRKVNKIIYNISRPGCYMHSVLCSFPFHLLNVHTQGQFWMFPSTRCENLHLTRSLNAYTEQSQSPVITTTD